MSGSWTKSRSLCEAIKALVLWKMWKAGYLCVANKKQIVVVRSVNIWSHPSCAEDYLNPPPTPPPLLLTIFPHYFSLCDPSSALLICYTEESSFRCVLCSVTDSVLFDPVIYIFPAPFRSLVCWMVVCLLFRLIGITEQKREALERDLMSILQFLKYQQKKCLFLFCHFIVKILLNVQTGHSVYIWVHQCYHLIGLQEETTCFPFHVMMHAKT